MDDGVPPAEALTRTGTSQIAGHGVFAGVRWPCGDHVVTVPVDVRGVGDLGHLNHSCDPNLGWSGAHDLVARRDIAEGEELTVDYSTAIDDDGFVLYCHCGTYRCRQAVEGRDWQIPQLQQRYAGHWTPRLQDRIDNLLR